MREIRTIHYDRSAPEAVAIREALRPPLLALARARDRCGVQPGDADLFNLELAELQHRVQDDPEIAARSIVELVLTLDEAVNRLAASGIAREAQVHQLLGERAS